MTASATKRTGQSGKSIEEVVAYAVGHRIRVQILILLNEGTYAAGEIADLIGEPLNKVGNHIRELVDAGSIEVAETKQRRNTVQHFYRAVHVPLYSKEEVLAMTPQERQVTAGLIIQSLLAEVMAGLWAGRMSDDPGVCLVWDRLNLDAQGRREVADEQERSWLRLAEIEEESLNRVAASGEGTTSYIASALGFERARKAPQPPRSADGD
jgi:DNA-binding transcriptional ArsR family regulator